MKYTKWPQNTPNGHKIHQMATQQTNIFNCRPSEIYPNWDFWLEKMPSGNPEFHAPRPLSKTVDWMAKLEIQKSFSNIIKKSPLAAFLSRPG
jgi:hypothetical protein